MSTIATPIPSDAIFASPNAVKVVLRPASDGVARAMYFSRAPIPHVRDGGDRGERLLHVGIYAYRAGFLRQYAALPPTALERVEKLEQLRALEHGFEIAVGVRAVSSVGVDTPEDYERFVDRWVARKRSP